MIVMVTYTILNSRLISKRMSKIQMMEMFDLTVQELIYMEEKKIKNKNKGGMSAKTIVNRSIKIKNT